MQLVVSGNRILAHGEGFLAMGGTVIHNETGRVWQSATVVECDCCPTDIDSVGYEYHAGQFVPCAPYGKGKGNLAVVCNNDCKSIKDSGWNITDLFSPATAERWFGDAEAVPDDVLSALSVLNRHTWEKDSASKQYVISEGVSRVSVNLVIDKDYDKEGSVFYYSDKIAMSSSGVLSLVSPVSTTVNYKLKKLAPDLANKYITFDNSLFYHVDSTGIISGQDDKNRFYLRVNAYVVYGKNLNAGDHELVSSLDREAYPDNASEGSFHYTYLGHPLLKALTAMQYKFGTYVGDGGFGASNKNSLTLDFVPRVLIVVRADMMSFGSGVSLIYIGQPGDGFEVVDKTIYWHSTTSAEWQCNTAGQAYYYFSMG
jgi:hypothetical protein